MVRTTDCVLHNKLHCMSVNCALKVILKSRCEWSATNNC